MPRSSKKQQGARFTVLLKCVHRNTLTLSQSLSLLQTLSTAQSTDAFRELDRLQEFVDLCTQEPCSHFKLSFLAELWPGVCQASARALQLLHGSAGSFQRQSEEVLLSTCMLLASLYNCISMIKTDVDLAQPKNCKAQLERLLAAVTSAGELMDLPNIMTWLHGVDTSQQGQHCSNFMTVIQFTCASL